MSGPKRPKLKGVRGINPQVIRRTIQKAAQDAQRVDTTQVNLADVAKMLKKK